jgi:hypothetical protein
MRKGYQPTKGLDKTKPPKGGTAEEVKAQEPVEEPDFLDLDEIAPSLGTLKFNGQTYNLRHPTSFGVTEYARLDRLQKQFAAAQKQVAAEPDNLKHQERLMGILTEGVRLMVEGLDGDTAAKMSDLQKLRVLNFFTRRMRASKESDLTAFLDQQEPSPDSPSGTTPPTAS